MSDGPALTTQGVSHRFRPEGPAALADLDLELRPGCLTALLGPNGSGKSTLLRLLAGILRPSQGQVTLQPAAGPSLDPGRASRLLVSRQLSFLPSRPQIPADYSALEVTLMARHPFGRARLVDQESDIQLATSALERTGALPYRDRNCLELSSGERQRVLLARILCQGARVALLDEPTSAQDPAHGLDAFQLLSELARQEGWVVVVATHNLNAAARHADRLVVLREGRVVRDGAPREVLTPELMAEVFEVEALLGEDSGAPFVVPRGRAAP